MTLRRSSLADVLSKLTCSPLFQLSLGSKELFHSNFLAWLCESYPDQTAKIFSRFLPQQPTALTPLKADREKKNVDLLISFPDGMQLVVENKVKSIPREQQLREYAAAVKDKTVTGFLLLSLTRPGFLSEGETAITLCDGVKWHHLSYRGLAQLLGPIARAVSDRNTYHGSLLNDYIDFISLLDDLLALVAIDWDSQDTDFYAMQNDRRLIKNCRLHDLVDKLRFSELAWRTKGELEKQGFANVVMGPLPDGEPGQIAIFSGMTRGVGLFDLKYLVTKCGEEPVMLGVQVQGQDIRLVVEMRPGQKQSREIAESLLKPPHGVARIWFNFDSVPGDSEEFPKNGNLNQYSGVFWYRSKRLGRISPAKLIDTIIQYARLIRDQEPVLREQIQNR